MDTTCCYLKYVTAEDALTVVSHWNKCLHPLESEYFSNYKCLCQMPTKLGTLKGLLEELVTLGRDFNHSV